MTTRTTSSDVVVGDDSRVRYWPDLTFWYGISPAELALLPNNIRKVYEKALPRVKAEQQAMMLDAASFPKMKESSQKRLINRLDKDLKAGLPKEKTAVPVTSPEDLRKANIGIDMVFVDKDGNPVEVENQAGRPAIGGKAVGGD